jgi:hypothetical protein
MAQSHARSVIRAATNQRLERLHVISAMLEPLLPKRVPLPVEDVQLALLHLNKEDLSAKFAGLELSCNRTAHLHLAKRVPKVHSHPYR